MSGIESKTAIVTGATQGIGLAVVEVLVNAGADILIGARTRERLESVCTGFNSAKGSVAAQTLDLSDFDSIDSFCDVARRKFADLNIVVLCAGAYEFCSWDTQITDALSLAMKVNVLGNARLIENMISHLSASDGHIVFVNSSIVRGDGAGNPAHAASQHALRSLADSLRAHVNASGVRVTTIYPGKTATPRQASIFAERGLHYRPAEIIQARDIASMVLECLVLPHRAEVTDIHIRQTEKI